MYWIYRALGVKVWATVFTEIQVEKLLTLSVIPVNRALKYPHHLQARHSGRSTTAWHSPAQEDRGLIPRVVCAYTHNSNAGFSSADESAIVLDIRQLQSKELTSEGVAHFGSGNTWGDMYAWLEEQNLSAIGGRDQQVGLGGFLLGGEDLRSFSRGCSWGMEPGS